MEKHRENAIARIKEICERISLLMSKYNDSRDINVNDRRMVIEEKRKALSEIIELSKRL